MKTALMALQVQDGDDPASNDRLQIELPDSSGLDQNEEYAFVRHNGTRTKIRFHDYRRIFDIPGCYEKIFRDRLECCSPEMVSSMLEHEVQKEGSMEDLRVLDFGAGNGMVAEELNRRGTNHIVGVDILKEARNAALRDRPDTYDSYEVLNLADLTPEERARLEGHNFNALVTVAALGFDDIPVQAFKNAYKLLAPGSWIAFNIRDKFLAEGDTSQYRETVNDLFSNGVRLHSEERYVHRRSITGEPLYYHALVGRKTS